MVLSGTVDHGMDREQTPESVAGFLKIGHSDPSEYAEARLFVVSSSGSAVSLTAYISSEKPVGFYLGVCVTA